ncbi:hypothetical protein Q428_02265 [Fervidicella metallireducens AeB]|uniref:Uncharacterized protein n=1 Tax=Fervidicella metallireducens AeB TaxID=1403537 RepID=A0A017RZY6_9CLOT|nr:hypothetical protein [Fervidicella metallireducens]EYE89485.1 hypothetical protein Q428_02265 [Fervidicella metallireducens AeB]
MNSKTVSKGYQYVSGWNKVYLTDDSENNSGNTDIGISEKADNKSLNLIHKKNNEILTLQRINEESKMLELNEIRDTIINLKSQMEELKSSLNEAMYKTQEDIIISNKNISNENLIKITEKTSVLTKDVMNGIDNINSIINEFKEILINEIEKNRKEISEIKTQLEELKRTLTDREKEINSISKENDDNNKDSIWNFFKKR